MDVEVINQPLGNRFKKRVVVYGVSLLLLTLILLTVVWLSRISIAENLAENELDKRNVQASYEIVDIGFNKQVIENLVLGDPAKPDLTAERIEIGNSISFGGFGVQGVSAKNIKLFGTMTDGKFSMGELDKFLDPDDDSAFALPDIWLQIDGGQARVDTDFGAVGVSLNGVGKLHGGFRGEVAAISDALTMPGCRVSKPSFFGEIRISGKKPNLKGPLRFTSAACEKAQFSSKDMAAQIDMTLGKELASWEGNIGLTSGPIKYAGYSAQEVKTFADVRGDLLGSHGVIDVTANRLFSEFGGAEIVQLRGPLQVGYGASGVAMSFEGEPILRSVRISPALANQLNAAVNSTQQTPVGPLTRKLISAINRASSNTDVRSSLKFKSDIAGSRIVLETLEASSSTGARASLSNPLAFILDSNGFAMGGKGHFSLNGGGFPNLLLALDSGSLSQGLSGRLQMASYQSGSAKLALPHLRFSPSRGGGTDIDGQLILAGPLPDGQINGLNVPISGSIGSAGAFALFRQCVTISVASARMSTLTTGPVRANFCPLKGSIISNGRNGLDIATRTNALKIQGAIGDTPLSVSSGALGFSLHKGFQAKNISARLGAGEELSQLEMAFITGVFGQQITGKIGGASGNIANVPLLLEQVEGDWRYAKGAFTADAMMRVRDAEQVERFRPLVTNDAAIRFAEGKFSAAGNLREPTTDTKVALVEILHRLNDGTGGVVFDVGNINFTDNFQPDLLTPLTLGVIANLDGAVNGKGQVNWNPSEGDIKSSGTFDTQGMNFAAAFGPVTGLSGEVEFVDLLTMTTAPGQSVRIEELNPGVAVYNGVLRYSILPGFKMQIDGGEWPFAGGILALEPTILDLTEDAERQLVFSVEGVDAARFLTQFDFENMSATGVFDGRLPMIFDQDGGRIDRGYLVAREGGGSISYIGDLTYEDMGTFANFAFSALKSLNYSNLTIGMDGALDGEMVAEVKFSGLQQGDTAHKNFITKQIAKIPLEFNVRIEAPFMRLMSSAKAYFEPEILVGKNLQALLRAQEARAKEANGEIKDVDE